MGGSATAGLAAAFCLLLSAPAFAQDDRFGQNDFGGFRNVLPGGQGEGVNAAELVQNQATGAVPKSFTDQLPLYTDLLYATPALTAADLDKYFKPAGFGARSADVASTENPKPGVTIVRDQWNVPHVYGATRADTMFGAGYASATDRMFLMDVLRHTGRARLSELIGPGEKDANIKADAEQLKIADYSEEELQRMIEEGRRTAGAEGEVVYQDLLAYVAGINAWIAQAKNDPNQLPAEYPALGKQLNDWKPTDTVAVASLIGGIFGRGGGTESLNSEILRAIQERFGKRKARAVFNDFRRAEDPEAPVTTPRRFPFDNPGKRKAKAIAALDPDSLENRDPSSPSPRREPERAPEEPPSNPSPLPIPLPLPGTLGLKGPASNALLVRGNRTPSGRAIAVMGPQVGYYSPQILMELDLHGPGIDARGAAFPGVSLYVLLGRGQDFAWSATTATTDVVDEFVEKLCEPDGSAPTTRSKHYMYKGRCIPFLRRDHVINTTAAPTEPGSSSKTYTLKVERSVHGPIQGYAEVRGQPVAIAEARSTYFHELESAIAFKRLNSNEVRDATTFQQAMGQVNFAFNWFYADDRDIAYLQSGWYPRRARGVDPNLPAWGTGEWDWRGFDAGAYTSLRVPFSGLPKDINPARGYIISWNNKQAPGWRAADDNWVYGSVHRSERLERRVQLGLRRGRKIDLTRLTQIMMEGATVDVRGQDVYPWIKRMIGRSDDPEVRSLLGVLDDWRRRGAHRRDLNRDNVLDDSPAVALMDEWWEPVVRAVFQPRLSLRVVDKIRKVAELHQQPGPGGSAFFTGWYGHVEKDLRTILGKRVRGKLSRRYCGNGSRRVCRQRLERTLKQAAADLRRKLGNDMSSWKVAATCKEGEQPQLCDQIEFTTAGAVATPPIHWQDRPTFQQVVEVQGHRPR